MYVHYIKVPLPNAFIQKLAVNYTYTQILPGSHVSIDARSGSEDPQYSQFDNESHGR